MSEKQFDKALKAYIKSNWKKVAPISRKAARKIGLTNAPTKAEYPACIHVFCELPIGRKKQRFHVEIKPAMEITAQMKAAFGLKP